MGSTRHVALAAALAGFCGTASAQSTQDEFWPRVQTYIAINPITRFYVLAAFVNHQEGNTWRGNFGVHLDFALKPVLRRDLRNQDDVFKKRYLTLQAGYRYISSLPDNALYAEQRGLVELTARWPLPGGLLVSDRNRGEFRFIRGEPFSARYRNRLQLEHDFSIRKFVYTPYVNGEVFYDTRDDAWTRTRYSAGVEVPVTTYLVLAIYYLRQHDTRSSPPHANVLGLDIRPYF